MEFHIFLKNEAENRYNLLCVQELPVRLIVGDIISHQGNRYRVVVVSIEENFLQAGVIPSPEPIYGLR